MPQRLDNEGPIGKETLEKQEHFRGFENCSELVGQDVLAIVLDLHLDHAHRTHPIASAAILLVLYTSTVGGSDNP